jgi:hypothetical protein
MLQAEHIDRQPMGMPRYPGRDTATVLLAVGGASLSVMSLHCRWSSDVMRVSKPVWL